MIPSDYYSHNPDDLRDNYDNDNYSATNFQPNANNFQNNYPQNPQSFMLQQSHLNNKNRAPSYTNFSDTGVSLVSNKSQQPQYTPSYNKNNNLDNNALNYNNKELGDYNNNFNDAVKNDNMTDESNLQRQEGAFRSPTAASSIHPSSYLPSSIPPHDRPQSRTSNTNYLPKDNRITPSPFPLVEGGVLNNSYRPQSTNQISRAQSSNQFNLDSSQEKPDLSEVIDLLSHHNSSVQANAAAYLQHISYMDDNVKVQTKALRGLKPLIDLLSHADVQVHRAACGALRNLSYGRANDDNKREIRNLGGVAGLARLLGRCQKDDVQELVTGIIWNLSSCSDIKTPIIDESMKALMDVVVIPLSGWSRGPSPAIQEAPTYRSTIFRNATGVLRNVSSEGEYARRKMREYDGLVQSLFQVLLQSTQRQDCDNKSIENCVCVLRNLSFALQEVADPEYLKKRMAIPHGDGEDGAGCFGNKSKLTHKMKSDSKKAPSYKPAHLSSKPGMALLWSPRLLDAYLPLLRDCSNPDTLEATAGTIQNVTACCWQPSVEFRAAVRKEGGLPILTDLLNYSSDKVICSAATALRNLAIDEKNKEQIGKQSMRELVSKLPSPSTDPSDYPLSSHTLAALLSTLYEVIKSSLPFTRFLVGEGGVARLISISKSPPSSFSDKCIRYANHLLYKIWKQNELQEGMRRQGWSLEDMGRVKQGGKISAENTINRPIMSQGPHDNNSYKNSQSLSNQGTLEYKAAGVQRAPNSDEEIALDVFQNMQLNDRYAGPVTGNNDNDNHLENHNKIQNNINYSNNSTINDRNKNTIDNQAVNNNNRNNHFNNNFANNDNYDNHKFKDNNEYNRDSNIFNNNNNMTNNYNTNSQNNSNINLNNNSDLFNQNYVSNSYSNNSRLNSNNNINNFPGNQDEYRLSSNTNASNYNFNNNPNNNSNNNSNNFNNNPSNNSNNFNNNTNNLNNNSHNFESPNNNYSNNNYNSPGYDTGTPVTHNSQQNLSNFSNTMQGFIADDFSRASRQHHHGYQQ